MYLHAVLRRPKVVSKLEIPPWVISFMRKPITMRFDPDLLTQARRQAARENRSLTNFIETVVRERVTDTSPTLSASDAAAAKPSPMPCPAAGRDR
jgi:hypothetical protein